jgi:hypothetical protein
MTPLRLSATPSFAAVARTCDNRLQRLSPLVPLVPSSPLTWVFSDRRSVQCCLVRVRKLQIGTRLSTARFAEFSRAESPPHLPGQGMSGLVGGFTGDLCVPNGAATLPLGTCALQRIGWRLLAPISRRLWRKDGGKPWLGGRHWQVHDCRPGRHRPHSAPPRQAPPAQIAEVGVAGVDVRKDR